MCGCCGEEGCNCHGCLGIQRCCAKPKIKELQCCSCRESTGGCWFCIFGILTFGAACFCRELGLWCELIDDEDDEWDDAKDKYVARERERKKQKKRAIEEHGSASAVEIGVKDGVAIEEY
jgi:hypothetical protein